MRLGARKARRLDVGEVIVLGIISGPSELVIKVRSQRHQSVAAVVCLVDAFTLLFVREVLSSLCAESSVARIALRRPPIPSST